MADSPADPPADPLRRCELHELQNCAICNPPPLSYQRGADLASSDLRPAECCHPPLFNRRR